MNSQDFFVSGAKLGMFSGTSWRPAALIPTIACSLGQLNQAHRCHTQIMDNPACAWFGINLTGKRMVSSTTTSMILTL
jgi:hypothetical protein